MMNERLISFDLKADFGFFKKPDINDTYLTYNMLHKPALLGILGAIIGLKGFEQNKRLPDYYTLLKHVKIGIKPLETDNGNFLKCFIEYNNATGMASKEEGGILQVREQTLVHPAYRCFLLLNDGNETERILYDYLKSYHAEFLPYMGKNDFSAWWDNFIEYTSFSRFSYDRNYRIDSIFRNSEVRVSDFIASAGRGRGNRANSQSMYIYIEKLPVSFNEELFQYEYGDFVYSPNVTFDKETKFSDSDFYVVKENRVIELF